jgi:hypothetical protein
MFVISQDLQFFVHDHPVFGPDGKFRYEITFLKAGLYRLLGDFYPDGATPQLIAKTIIVPGGSQSTPSLNRDYSTRDAGNMQVSLETDPPDPIAGTKTMMFFKLNPAEGIEKYIGAWGHMLAASDDLIDLIHTQPIVCGFSSNEKGWSIPLTSISLFTISRKWNFYSPSVPQELCQRKSGANVKRRAIA